MLSCRGQVNADYFYSSRNKQNKIEQQQLENFTFFGDVEFSRVIVRYLVGIVIHVVSFRFSLLQLSSLDYSWN